MMTKQKAAQRVAFPFLCVKMFTLHAGKLTLHISDQGLARGKEGRV
jgi:hypothetical protein